MRILLCNKFYYRRGGDCIYTINLEKMLSARGHELAVFAMDCEETLDTPWRKYFASEVSFESLRSKLKYAARCLGSGDVSSRFTKLLDDFRPDIVHLNNIHSQLSPVIAAIAHGRGIKVVWTLHDYKLLCPRYDCRLKGEQACELCFRNKFAVLANSCMKNSFAASCIAYAEAVKWNRHLLEKLTDVFLCPSLFMREKMLQGGFNGDKLIHLPNSVDVESCKRDDYNNREDYYCYVGRLSKEKGVETLVEAASQLPYKLVVVGSGPLSAHLRRSPVIEYVGQKTWQEVKSIVGRARFSVMPSECFENNPLSVIESLCLGTPVLGAKVGGIPELIDDELSGLAFESGNSRALAEGITEMFSRSFDYQSIAEKSQGRYSQQEYYRKLMDVYTNKL